MSETPLLFTDLLSPTSLAKYQKKKENINAPFVEENNVIPIKTWTTGSPLDKKRFFKDDLHDIKEGDGMETYYAKAFGDPTDEEANAEDDEEDGDDEAENTQQDDDDDEEEATDHKFEYEDGELIREVPDYMLSTAEYEEEGMEEYLNENDFDGAQYTENEEEEEEEGDDEEEDDDENQGKYEEEEEEEAYGDDYNDDEEEEYENDQDHDDDDNDPKQPKQKKEQIGMFSDLIGLINSYEEMKEEVIRESRTFKNSKSGEVIPSPAKHEDFSAEDLMRLEQDGEGDDEDTTSIVNEYKDLLEYLASPRNNNDDHLANEDTNHLFDNDFDVFPSAAMTTKLMKKLKSKPSGAKSNKGKEQNIMTKTKKTLQPSAKNNNFFYYPSAGSAAEEKKLNENYRYQSSSVEEGNDDDYEENDPALLEMVKVSKAALKQIMTNNDENHQNQQKKKKSTKKPQKDHKKFYNLEPKIVKKSHPLIKKQGADKAKLLAAQKRHRDMLADIVNKRKAEEEELLDLAAKAQEKRKKFKEALLEKAIKAKKEQEENIVEEVEVIKPPPKQAVFATQPSSNAAPPRYLQSIVTNRKSPQEIIADADELAKQEEEKRERIASIRRKFKEQHKRLLISLMLKKKEEELVEEQQQILEQIAKEKRKKKMMKMLSEKTPEKNLLIVPNSKEIEEEDKPSVKKAVLIHHQSQSLSNIPSEMTNDVQQVTARVAAGSAIQAIRQRSHSVRETSTTQTNKQKKPQQKPSKQSIEEDNDVKESESDTDGPIVVTKLEENEENPEEIQKKLELLEAKRQFSLQQSKKIAAYLNALTEQKKKEEIEKKKKEDRQKKRMILLSQRLLKEATERKLMIAEDKPIYRELYQKKQLSEMEELEKNLPIRKNVVATGEGNEKKKKITPEMAEIIAARLNKRSSISNNTTEGDREANSAPAAGSKAVKAKVDRQRVINNKDSSDDDNHNETVVAVKHTNPPIPTIVPTNIIYRDFNDWKRKNNVPVDAKVFCMTGWYPCVKQALIDRGWHFNPDPTSPYCHLKWTLRSIDINQDSLQPWQLTNHYCKNVAITTKAGLIKSLQSLIWMANVDIHDIIPRAYDVTTQDDLVSFLDDYRNQKAESILKKLYYQVTGLETILFDNPNEYRPLSSAVSAGRGGGDASPIFERKKQSPTTKEDSEVDGEGEDAAEEESGRREKQEKIEIAPLTITQSVDEMDQESKPITTSTTFDLNDFALPSIPPLPDSVHALNPFPEIEINGAIFEITCQLLEHQMKPYNIGSRKTGRSRRRGQETGRKSSNQLEEEESRSTRAAKHNDSDEEEETEDEQEEDDINVCDYDYCPSGYHEINIKNNNTHNLPNNNNNYSTGIHPYINYPKSVINGIKLVSDLHWEVIDNYSIYQSIPSLPFDAPEPLDGFLRNNNNTNSGNSNSAAADDEYDEITGKKYTYQQLQREKRRLMKIYEEHREALSQAIHQPLRKLTFHDLERMHTILSQRILYSYGKAQSYLNGKNPSTENLWIVKPAAKSRGRGIMTFSNIHKLLKYIDAGNGLSTQWIVQKYMENPLIIAKRKFDLRQWILVTSWNPLTIYFYHECYARFSVEEYTTNLQELENSFIHLVNNSIGKNSENFNKIILAENNQPMEGYMWDFRTFSEYITWKNQGINLVERKIQPRMKEIAIYALMCASEMIEHRKNSWELYGFDFMVDDQYNTWLIEINSSPACDYSTKVTERYVQKALVELLSVVLDVREWEAQPKKQRGEKPSTGGWECIYQGPVLELPIGSFGTDFSLKGESVKGMNRRNQASIPVVSATMAASIGGGNGGDLSVVSIGMNNKHHQDSFTGGGNESNSYRSTSGRKANTKPPIKSSSNNNTSNSNSAIVKASMPKPVQGSTNARTKPANVARRHHDEALILDDEDDDSSVATNDKFHRRERNSSAALSHRSNSGQPDLASETYDDSSDDHEKKPSKHTTTTTTNSATTTMNSKSNASPSAAPSNNPHIGVKKEGSIVNKAAVAIPIKTFNVDF